LKSLASWLQKSVVDFSSKHLRGDSNLFAYISYAVEIIYSDRTRAIKFIIQNKLELLKTVILVKFTYP